ncbi:uncharacterized protein LOC136066856 [Quercus suber]|uniref:uncharacterized protein LOC136066856 n=1 Tax=Quercus suber TaxID=58331 RepID=UPI0032DFEF95
MSLHTHNDALICKVFPSSLGPTALRWFNGLRKGSIHSFAKLIQEIDVRFMTRSRVLQSMDALLSIKMGAGETLRSYNSRYWELYYEISGGNEKIVVSTFRLGLPEDSKLRDSLTRRPPEDMRQLMKRIKKLLKDHLEHGKGGVFERVCGGPKKSGSRAGYPTSRKSSPAPIESDRSHPCNFKGYPVNQEERGTSRGSHRELFERATLREEVEVHSGAYCLQ